MFPSVTSQFSGLSLVMDIDTWEDMYLKSVSLCPTTTEDVDFSEVSIFLP